MKIQGLPLGTNNINNIGGKNTQKVSAKNIINRADSVEISEPVVGRDMINEASIVVETEFQPRTELIESVSRRISGGEYNNQEMLGNIAERVIEANVVSNIVSERPGEVVRAEKIEQVTENIANNLYNNQEIIREIANRITTVVGLSDLFENTGDL